MNALENKQTVFQDFPVREAEAIGGSTLEIFIDFAPIMAAFEARCDAADAELIAARRGGETVELSEALSSLGL
jgi:hypothetical protein